jgi:hypothetical protein
LQALADYGESEREKIPEATETWDTVITLLYEAVQKEVRT